jgi:NTE family protein
MRTALVLAGAVAKGAFEAGVLSVLAQTHEDIGMIVATSAGALNAAVYATGIRHGRVERAAEVLSRLWDDRADLEDVAKLDLHALFGLRGISSSARLGAVVTDGMDQAAAGAPPQGAIELRLVTTRLSGKTQLHGEISGTTFEEVVAFSAEAFDTRQSRADVARAALASAAFPVLYEPVEVRGVGPCVDGGVVNNTPISWAIEGGAERVIVVTGSPAVAAPDDELSGVSLLAHEVDIAINERLFRDLLQARTVNRKLARLENVFQSQNVNDEQRTEILNALGWRPLDIVEIRPTRSLPGNAFSALRNRDLRLEYLQIGRDAAREALRLAT